MRKLLFVICLISLQAKAENKCITQQELHEKSLAIEMLVSPKIEIEGNLQKLEMLGALRGIIKGEEEEAIDFIDETTNSYLIIVAND